MSDHKDSGIPLRADIFHQLQDLSLDGNVKSGGGLVRDKKLRLAGHRHSDHNTLAHTAGKLMRITPESHLRLRDTYGFQYVNSSLVGLLLGKVVMKEDRLRKLCFNSHTGIQGVHGLLEDHSHFTSSDFSHPFFVFF